MALQRFQDLMEVVAQATWGVNGARSWAGQMAFLESKEGAEYFEKLDKALKAHVHSL
jgi:hypothetical protein